MPDWQEWIAMFALIAALGYVSNWMWAVRRHLSLIEELLADIRDEVRRRD